MEKKQHEAATLRYVRLAHVKPIELTVEKRSVIYKLTKKAHTYMERKTELVLVRRTHIQLNFHLIRV